jgi:hypothetical protein
VSFIKNEKLSYQKMFTIVLIIFGIAESASQYLSHSCATQNSFTEWVPYAGLFLFGYLVASGNWKIKKSKWLVWVYAAGLVSTVVLNYIYYSYGSIDILRTLPTACLSQYSDYYLSINVVLMSLTAFVFLINLSYKFIRNTIWEKTIYSISRASFGIYLVNLLIVSLFDKWLHLDVDSVHIPLWSYVIVKLVIVFGLSFALTSILRKIPVVKRVMGETK